MMSHEIRLVFSAFLVLAACTDETMPPADDTMGSDTTDESTDTGETGDECEEPDGCFACEPTTSVELSNACTDATCEPFANTSERLPLLEGDDSLPPIP